MPVQSVDRAVAILRELTSEEPVLGVTQLSDRLGLHKSTVHRLLASLRRGGLVQRDPKSRKYRLGVGLLELSFAVLDTHGILRVVHPYLHYIADAVEEAAYLAVQEGDEVLNVVQVRGPNLRELPRWTPRGPIHCTSTGKIFLAHMQEDELKAILEKGLPRLTEKTITDATDLRHELERVREQGFATSFEECKDVVNSISAPVTGPDGKVIAALGTGGRSYRFTHEKALGSAEIIIGIAKEVSQKIESLPPADLVFYG